MSNLGRQPRLAEIIHPNVQFREEGVHVDHELAPFRVKNGSQSSGLSAEWYFSPDEAPIRRHLQYVGKPPEFPLDELPRLWYI